MYVAINKRYFSDDDADDVCFVFVKVCLSFIMNKD